MIDLIWGGALRGTVLLAAAWLAAFLLRRDSADLRHRVWLAALIGTALLILPLPAPRTGLLIVSTALNASAAVSRPGSGLSVLPMLWSAGTLLVAARILWNLAQIARASRDSEPFGRVRISSAIPAPCTWGAVRPVILLPAPAREWSPQRRDLAIRHESAHVARRDWLWQTLAQAITAIFWFHPLVWFAASRLREEAEFAADAQVLADGADAPGYAGQLVAAAREMRVVPSWAGVPMVRTTRLEQRIVAILDATRPRTPATPRARVALILATLLLTIFAAAQDSPIYRASEPGVTAPFILFKVDPAYTQEARDAKVQGTVVLRVVIDQQGLAQDIAIERSLDTGLDQKAIEAIRQWRFRPGMKDNAPVRVSAVIEINFKLM
jgi:TonB family protein